MADKRRVVNVKCSSSSCGNGVGAMYCPAGKRFRSDGGAVGSAADAPDGNLPSTSDVTVVQTPPTTTIHALFQTSGDCLMEIFRRVRSPKQKVRLELVCQTFRKFVQQSESWELDTVMCIADPTNGDEVDTFCQLNDDRLRLRYIRDAIEALVKRMKLKEVNLWWCTQEVVHSTLCAAFIREEKRIPLDVLIMNGRKRDSYVTPFLQAFRDSLEVVEVTNCAFKTPMVASHFWRCLEECGRLKMLRFESYLNADVGDRESNPNEVVAALKSRNWQKLALLDIECLTIEHLAEILQRTQAHQLDTLEISFPDISMEALTDQMDNAYFWKLKTLRVFRLELFAAEVTIMKNVLTMCPEVFYLSFITETEDFCVLTAIELISHYLNTLATQRRRIELELNLNEASTEQVLGALILREKCDYISTVVDSEGNNYPIIVKHTSPADIDQDHWTHRNCRPICGEIILKKWFVNIA